MIQQKQVDYSKELDDVMVLVVGLVADIKGGKSLAEISADALPNLMNAVAGANSVPEELAASRKVALQTIGYRSGELADALLA